MKTLRQLASLGAVSVLSGYVLVVKSALAPGVPPALLGAIALFVAYTVALAAFGHRERVHKLHSATDAHQKAQAVLQARVEELDKSLKSLTNAVGQGVAWK